jgi:AcrR family transcriptional regulator
MSPAALGQTPVAEAPGKREASKAANRAAILAAARDVFAELGYGQATVRDVVRRTDLAAGTFYNYFPDKESVLRALVEDNSAVVQERLRAVRARAETLEDFLRGGYRVWFEYIVEDRATFELMRRNAGTIRELLDQPALGAGVDDLEDDLRALVKRGDLPPHDLEYMAAAMAGVGVEVGMRMIERVPPDVEGATALAVAIFLGGLERLAQA